MYEMEEYFFSTLSTFHHLRAKNLDLMRALYPIKAFFIQPIRNYDLCAWMKSPERHIDQSKRTRLIASVQKCNLLSGWVGKLPNFGIVRNQLSTCVLFR